MNALTWVLWTAVAITVMFAGNRLSRAVDRNLYRAATARRRHEDEAIGLTKPPAPGASCPPPRQQQRAPRAPGPHGPPDLTIQMWGPCGLIVYRGPDGQITDEWPCQCTGGHDWDKFLRDITP
jgi:hypothetical protein